MTLLKQFQKMLIKRVYIKSNNLPMAQTAGRQTRYKTLTTVFFMSTISVITDIALYSLASENTNVL